MSWWTADRQQHAYSYLTAAGLSPYGAAGLVSRWKNVEASAGPASRNPSSGAWGIAQWLGPRLPAINGNANFDSQLNYVVSELNGAEYRARQLLVHATDTDSGARAATAYERAEGWNAGTNTDNHTSRTAAGIPAVLAAVGSQATADGGSQTDEGVTGEPSAYANSAPVVEAAGISAGVIVLAGAGLLLLYLVLRD